MPGQNVGVLLAVAADKNQRRETRLVLRIDICAYFDQRAYDREHSMLGREVQRRALCARVTLVW
eukprot:scaffold92504_cov84-Phaeocystis_antarctica.AAC.1